MRLLPILLLTGCLGAQQTSVRHFTVHVYSQHWAADAVRVICEDGSQLGVVRAVDINKTVYRRLPWRCHEVRFVIEMFTGEAVPIGGWYHIRPNMNVVIGPQAQFSTLHYAEA